MFVIKNWKNLRKDLEAEGVLFCTCKKLNKKLFKIVMLFKIQDLYVIRTNAKPVKCSNTTMESLDIEKALRITRRYRRTYYILCLLQYI